MPDLRGLTAASDLSNIKTPSPQPELSCDPCRKDPGICHSRFKMSIKAICPRPDPVCFLIPNRYRGHFWKMGSTALTHTSHAKSLSKHLTHIHCFFFLSLDPPLSSSFQNTDPVTPFPPPPPSPAPSRSPIKSKIASAQKQLCQLHSERNKWPE